MIDTKKLRELAEAYAKDRMDYTDSEPDGWTSERAELFDALDRVTAERDALKGDAERYRWLRDKANYIRFDAPQVCITDWKGQIASTLASAYPSGEDLDNAIDAIRASKGEA